MSVTQLGVGQTVSVAVMIAQPTCVIRLPDGQVFRAESTPLTLSSQGEPARSRLGWMVQKTPTYGAANRALTPEEQAADVAIVANLPAIVGVLRDLGFRGEILSPGPIKDGAADAGTMVQLAPAL